MRDESVKIGLPSVAVGLSLAGIAALFFYLIGTPRAAEVPYVVAICTTCAVLFFGSMWIAETRARSPVRGVFVVIGSSFILSAVLLDCTLTLAYRAYLHVLLSAGVLYAVLVLVNGLCLLLVAVLPIYSRFAGGLSATDAQATAERSDLAEELLAAEERFFAVSAKFGKRYSASDRFPITVLREKAGFLTPAIDGSWKTLLDADALVREHVSQVDAIVHEGTAIDSDNIDQWMRKIEESCSTAIRAMERRERVLVRQQNGTTND